jgi:hypothetical protein
MAMPSSCALARSSTSYGTRHPGDLARLEAQARLVAAYEEMKWPRRPPSVADLIRHLMDQHGLTRVAPPPKKPPPRPTREASPVGDIDVEGGSASTDPDRCPGGRKSGPDGTAKGGRNIWTQPCRLRSLAPLCGGSPRFAIILPLASTSYSSAIDLSGTTVEVLAIVAKSEAESWLAQVGNPE